MLPALAAAVTIAVYFEPAINALDHAGFWVPASRTYVRDKTGGITTQLTDMQFRFAHNEREQSLAARNKLEIDTAQLTDPTAKIQAQQEMRRLDDRIATLTDQIKALQATRGPQ